MKKIMWWPIITIILIVLTVGQSCKNADTPAGSELKFNLERNKQYDYDIAWYTDQELMDRNDRINLSTGYTLEVMEEKDKIKTLRVVYNSFRLYMKIMDFEMDIDSDKPVDSTAKGDDNTMKNAFTKIVGKSFSIKVDEEGNVQSVHGFEEIIKDIINAAGVNEDMKLQMRMSLQDQFNEQELRDQFAPFFMIFPNKVVKPGDSWQKDYRKGGKIPANFSTTYTVRKIDNDQLTLDTKAIITSAGEKMEVKGEQTGTLLVDSKTGMVVSAEFKQGMDAKMADFGMKVKATGSVKGKEK